MRQRCCQIDRCGCFSDAAFLICNRDDGSHIFSAPALALNFSPSRSGKPHPRYGCCPWRTP
jgi:hypothetical protein